jgi:hypothetical protein
MEIENLILERSKTDSDRQLLIVLLAHKPLTHDFGDQRDPDVRITCICKKDGYKINQLEVPYQIHLFDVLRPHFESARNYDGR